MFRKMPFILLAIILTVKFTGHWIPLSAQSILYGLSLTIKSGIVFLLPLVVFGLLFKTAVHFANKASKMVLLILFFICCSNFLSTLLSYSVGTLAYNFDLAINLPNEENVLHPLWNFSFPKWIGNDQAMFSGLILGIITGWFKPILAKEISLKLESIIKAILQGILLSSLSLSPVLSSK